MPTSSGAAEPQPPEGDRDSHFRLEISLSIGYKRKRSTFETKWEGRFITAALTLISALVTIYVVVSLFRDLARF